MISVVENIRACKKIASFFVGVGKHFLISSENFYPPLMNSVISRVGSYSFATPKSLIGSIPDAVIWVAVRGRVVWEASSFELHIAFPGRCDLECLVLLRT